MYIQGFHTHDWSVTMFWSYFIKILLLLARTSQVSELTPLKLKGRHQEAMLLIPHHLQPRQVREHPSPKTQIQLEIDILKPSS